ncbi:MAG: polysaccharide biosynthesis protein, partial [Planctomycetaceae bacterium]|nr:polysaccharide biosynthesis protein [Planctomycetaceae bacterium]
GSELCRQVLSFQPAELILLDQSENGMFRIQNELLPIAGPVKLRCVIADVCDAETIGTSMRECQPDIVFHAAAYKHVPLMEENPRQAVNNNVIGTRTVADAAHECGVSRFVLISTDKAVRPSSVMGSTKLVAEKYLQARALDSDTSYITVRFGNVLNSDGSVVPTFRSQIEAGGPLTVTHEEMRRFFMTIPEAVQLVLQAGASGSSGDVLILDMGEPIRIMDLARDMILLSGLRYPEDIDIEISGIRPGEKLVEELLYSSEQTSRRIHEKIYCSSRQAVLNLEQLDHEIRQLSRAVDEGAEPARTALAALVAQLVELEDRVIEDPTFRAIGSEQPQTEPQPVRRAA